MGKNDLHAIDCAVGQRESNKIVEWKVKLDFLAFIVVVKSVENL